MALSHFFSNAFGLLGLLKMNLHVEGVFQINIETDVFAFIDNDHMRREASPAIIVTCLY